MKDIAKQWWTRLMRDTAAEAGVKRSLAQSLDASSVSLIIGSIVGVALSGVIAVKSHDPAILKVMLAISVIAVIRVVSVYAFHRMVRRDPTCEYRYWAWMFEAGSWAYAGLVGLLAFSTVTRVEDVTLHVLAITFAAGYSSGICTRNAGRLHVAIGQCSLSMLPPAFALWINGEWAYRVLAVVIVLMLVGLIEIITSAHSIIVDALRGQREKSQLAIKYERLARFDSLTGVENRMAMQMRLREIFEKNRRTNDAVAILWMDLDRFKEINDSLGHMVGDHLLCAVVEKLAEALDGRGHVARFGGDEFILICPGVDRASAQAIAADVIDYFRHSFEIGGHTLSVTASIGIAVGPQDGRDVDELMQHADMALYQAKGSGRNRAVCFTWSMKERFNRLHDIETGLRRAIAGKELSLHFQPIFNLESGKIVGCEALLRWMHPVLGQVPPTEFIPVAENIGIISEISDWVLGEACAAAVEWPKEIRVAVNMSPALFQTTDLPRMVIGHLMATGLLAQRLEIEVTENLFLNDQPHTSAMLMELRKIGLRLALDDFGTGYSSLSYLSAYAFDTIKVDQTFMCDVHKNVEKQAVMRAIVFLATQLGMDTLAEGIESEEQQAYVQKTGFTYAQGFLMCQPQTRADITHMLQQGMNIDTQRALRPKMTVRKRA